MNSDKPKYFDHDFPLPYKTIPDGIMILSNNKDDDLFLHDDVVIDETASCNTVQELQEKAITIENETDRTNNALYRVAYTLKDKADVLVSFLAGCLLLGSLILPKKSWKKKQKQN